MRRAKPAGNGEVALSTRSPDADRPVEASLPERANPGLPGFLEFDYAHAAAGVGGLFASGVLNDQLIGPFVKRLTIIPGAHDVLGKAADGITTLFAAALVGAGGRMLLGSSIGNAAESGGQLLGAARILTAPFKNVSLSPNFPQFPLFPMTPAAPAVPANDPKLLNARQTELATGVPSGATAFNRTFGL